MSRYSQGPRVKSPQLKTQLNPRFTIQRPPGKGTRRSPGEIRENQMIVDIRSQRRFFLPPRVFCTA
jgi:hypothetical protein